MNHSVCSLQHGVLHWRPVASDLHGTYFSIRKTLRCGVTLLMYGWFSKVSRLLGEACRMWTSSKSLGKSEAGFSLGTMCHSRAPSPALRRALLMYRLRALAEKYPVKPMMYSAVARNRRKCLKAKGCNDCAGMWCWY